MNLPKVPLEEAKLGREYFVEFGWDDNGTYRRPAYGAVILSKDAGQGQVLLRRGVMGTRKNETLYEELTHPASDLAIYELPDESGTSSTSREGM